MVAALIMPRSATIRALDPEAAAQPLDDGQQGGDIGGIAGPREQGDRPIPLIQHDAEHHLRELRADVLGMAALAERGAAVAFDPLDRASALADVLNEVEILVAADLLDTDEMAGVPARTVTPYGIRSSIEARPTARKSLHFCTTISQRLAKRAVFRGVPSRTKCQVWKLGLNA
jgi:hypothetical protein